MLAFVDVNYLEPRAVAGCVLAEHWDADSPARERIERIDKVAPYTPGQFYLRELPCLLRVLRTDQAVLRAVVVDGYVWLARARPGLGWHLHRHLHQKTGRRIPVVGVAKTPFAKNDSALPVRRGRSQRPLWVTAVGVDLHAAAKRVQSMHGVHRIPTLLKRVDQLCRGLVR